MRILVIAASDSDGSNLGDRSKAWTELLRRALEASDGVSVELTYRRFYVHTDDWQSYFEGALASSEADLIMLGVNGVSWSFRTVPIRVRKLFGNRAGNWVERRQQGMDRQAKSNVLSALRARLVHWAVRHLIPPGSYLRRAEAERRYLWAIDRLAREEGSEVIVLNKTFMRGELLRAWPGVNDEVVAFNTVLERRTVERHLMWFDREAILTRLGESDAFLEDRVHRQAAFHREMADELFAAIRPGVSASRPSTLGYPATEAHAAPSTV